MGWREKESKDHFMAFIIMPALDRLQLNSPYAADLVFETGVIETGYRYIHQLRGPALGYWQMEPFTFRDMVDRVVPNNGLQPQIEALRLHKDVIDHKIDSVELIYNPQLAAAMTRIFYRDKPGAIPSTLEGRANYWKKYYNTYLGKGDPAEYVKRNQEYL